MEMKQSSAFQQLLPLSLTKQNLPGQNSHLCSVRCRTSLPWYSWAMKNKLSYFRLSTTRQRLALRMITQRSMQQDFTSLWALKLIYFNRWLLSIGRPTTYFLGLEISVGWTRVSSWYVPLSSRRSKSTTPVVLYSKCCSASCLHLKLSTNKKKKWRTGILRWEDSNPKTSKIDHSSGNLVPLTMAKEWNQLLKKTFMSIYVATLTRWRRSLRCGTGATVCHIWRAVVKSEILRLGAMKSSLPSPNQCFQRRWIFTSSSEGNASLLWVAWPLSQAGKFKL